MTTRAGAVGALLVLLLLAGCSGAPSQSSQGPQSSRGSTPAAPPVGYQDRLASVDTDMAAAFDAIGHARGPQPVARAVLEASGKVSAASQLMAIGGPNPAPVAGTNDQLVAALSQFANELAYLSQQVNRGAICTGGTALNAITTAPSMTPLREVAGTLARSPGGGPGYRWGGFLPAPREQTNARMPTGRLVVDRRTPPPGNGVLRISDDGAADAALILSRDGRTVVEVSVRAGDSTELTGLADGSYDVYYLTGTDWDDAAGMFGRDCEFHRFTDPSTFTSTPVPGGTAYTSQTITVHANATPAAPEVPDAPGTTSIPAESLPR